MILSKRNGLMSIEVPRTRHVAFGVSSTTVESQDVCPECGAAMIESDRLAEGGAVLIWYSCARKDCTGQWLMRKASRMCGV